jgi:hypothetical protein
MPNSPAPEALFTRLYFDRHIMARLAIDLRSRGYDVLTTEEAGLDTATDEQQLTFAAGERRAILTFNIRDFALSGVLPCLAGVPGARPAPAPGRTGSSGPTTCPRRRCACSC